MSRSKPKPGHPWKIFNPYSSKPDSVKDLLGYIVTAKKSKKQRRMVAAVNE